MLPSAVRPAALPGVSVIVPTWNGLSLLRVHLPSVRESLARYPGPWECLLVDDGGTDATAADLPELFPEARLLRHDHNRGFAAAVNTGLDAATHPLVLLLNNDIRVEPDFLAALARHFTGVTPGGHSSLFAVSALQINPGGVNGPPYDGCRTLSFRRGELCLADALAPEVDPRGQTVCPNALANGGCSLFSREKLRVLGNFSELFNPFYFEDAEVSLQALRRGWHMRFEPGSVVWHRPNTSTRQHPGGLSPTVVRNLFFFHWMLLDDPGLWVRHLAWIVPRLVTRTLRGQWSFAHGFLRALGSLSNLRRERRKRERGGIITPLTSVLRAQRGASAAG